MTNKIAIFVKSIDGGTGTYALNLLRLKQVDEVLDVQILCLEKPKFRKLPPEVPVRFLHDNGYYSEKFGFSVRSVSAYLGDYGWMQQQITKEKPMAVISVDLYCNLLCSLNGLIAKRYLLVLTEHIDIFSNMATRASKSLAALLQLLIRWLYPCADKIVFVSHALRDNFLRNTRISRQATAVVYNGIDLQKIPGKPVRRRRKIIITIARMVEQKDHETLLSAFQIVRKTVKDAQLWIVSDGYKKKELLSVLRKNPGVTIYGWVDDIYSFLKKADIFVLSSKREGFGIVLVEAMSQSLPIVSTDTNFGPSEVLGKGKYGFLVPVGDPKSMADRIITFLNDRATYESYSRASLKRSRFFSLTKMLKSYSRMLNDTKLWSDNGR